MNFSRVEGRIGVILAVELSLAPQEGSLSEKSGVIYVREEWWRRMFVSTPG